MTHRPISRCRCARRQRCSPCFSNRSLRAVVYCLSDSPGLSLRRHVINKLWPSTLCSILISPGAWGLFKTSLFLFFAICIGHGVHRQIERRAEQLSLSDFRSRFAESFLKFFEGRFPGKIGLAAAVVFNTWLPLKRQITELIRLSHELPYQ